jgi:hypothetical protein
VSHPATYFCSRQAHLLPQNLRKGISPVDYYIALDPVDKETLLDHFSSAPFKFLHPNPVLSSFISLKSHTKALAFFMKPRCCAREEPIITFLLYFLRRYPVFPKMRGKS